MPVVYFTGFNSPEMDLNKFGSWSANSAWTNLYIPGPTSWAGVDGVNRISEDNILTWSNGTYSPSKANPHSSSNPEIRMAMLGARYSAGSGYENAWCGLYVGRKELDSNQGCVIGYIANNPTYPTDFFLGMSIFPWSGIDYQSLSYRLGYRIRARLDSTSQYSVYFYCQGRGSSMATQRFSYSVPSLVKGTEVYVEWEWDSPSKTLKLYVDDALVISETASYDPRICGFYQEVYNPQSNSQATNTRFSRFFEVSDVYFQVVGSGPVSGEPRLGALTSVARVRVKADAAVQFSRPAGYETNTAVAVNPVIASNYEYQIDAGLEGRYLSANVVGQQDLYTVNATEVKSKMSIIHGVKSVSYGYNASSGERGETAKIVQGASEVSGPEQKLPSNDIIHRMRPCYALSTVNPETNQKWTAADLDAVRIGVKVTS